MQRGIVLGLLMALLAFYFRDWIDFRIGFLSDGEEPELDAKSSFYAFSVRDIHGKSFHLETLKNKVIL